MAEERPRDTADEQGDEPLGPVAARSTGERLRELADAEHARAEAGEHDDDAEAPHSLRVDDEQTPHPLEALGVEPCTDEALAALGEAAFGYAPCPFCDGYGAVDPDQLLAALPDIVRKLAPYPESTIFVRCEECDGWGSVLTGGRTSDNGIQPCPKCESHGYIDMRDELTRAADAEHNARVLDELDSRRGGDPFTLPPPEGQPPAAGMEWDDGAGRWGYPARVA